jgi:hypothetical protein
MVNENLTGEGALSIEMVQQLNDLNIKVQTDLNGVLDQINSSLNLSLQPRGNGAHITIVGPAEKKVLKSLDQEKIDELNAISEEIKRGEGIFVSGLGFIDADKHPNARDADKGKKVCFIALEIPRLAAVRADLGLPPRDFHITLGFIGNDIHFTDDNSLIPKKVDPAISHLNGLIPPLEFADISGNEKQKKKEKAPPQAPKVKEVITYDRAAVLAALRSISVNRADGADPMAIFHDEVESIADIAATDPKKLGQILQRRMRTFKQAVK